MKGEKEEARLSKMSLAARKAWETRRKNEGSVKPRDSGKISEFNEDAEVIVESPYQPDVDTAGNDTIVKNCDIRAYTVRFLAGGYAINPGSSDSHQPANMYIYNSTVYCFTNNSSNPTFGINFSTITSFTSWDNGAPSIIFDCSLFRSRSGTVLATVFVQIGEARILTAKTDSAGVASVTGNFSASGGVLTVIKNTDASFSNNMGMSAGSTTVQYVFS